MSGRLADLPAEAWPAFSRRLDEGLALTAPERAAWLDQLPPDEAMLRPFLEAALRADADIQAANAPGSPRIEVEAGEAGSAYLFEAGQRIGPYRLAEPLGTGGMGEVWQAARVDGSLTREVALKLPHTWLLSAGQRRRLARERDILAGLTHPNIAQLYDAGISAEGQPWLALERVDGIRIDQHCHSQRLSIATRLALFDQVLDAVQFAHGRLIVHRDLKPANILVSADGTVKLLDFGIAKLLDDGGVGESTELTRLAGRAATPEYAAPEQLGSGAITVATDVYSLGVVLYELLCGQRPPAASAALAGQEVPLASSRVLDAQASTLGISARQLRRMLTGDLDAILARALARDPGRRYASVERLADDLRRSRASVAIEARHITVVERGRRFLRRNRLAVAATAVFLLTVLGGTAASLWQARQAHLEAQRANVSRDFLANILKSNLRDKKSDRAPGSLTAREMIDDIVARIDGDLASQPETRLDLLQIAANAYAHWNDLDKLHRLLPRLRGLMLELHGPGNAGLVRSYLDEAQRYFDLGQIEAGRPALDRAGQLIRQYGHTDTLLEAEWLLVSKDADAAEIGGSPLRLQRMLRAVTLFARFPRRDNLPTYAAVAAAEELLLADRPEEALSMVRQGMASEQTRAEPSEWLAAELLLKLADSERALGDRPAALIAYDEGLRRIAATFGREASSYWIAVCGKATLMDWSGDFAGAHALFAQELSHLVAPAEETGLPDSGIHLNLCYARMLLSHGDAVAALPLLVTATTRQMLLRPTEFRDEDVLLALGDALDRLGHAAAARQALQQASRRYAALKPDHPGALEARTRWARFQLEHGETVAAEADFRAVLGLAAGPPRIAVADARMGLAEISARRGQLATARQLGQQSLDDAGAVTELFDPQRLRQLQLRFDQLQSPSQS